jgi:hypothetical protein
MTPFWVLLVVLPVSALGLLLLRDRRKRRAQARSIRQLHEYLLRMDRRGTR